MQPLNHTGFPVEPAPQIADLETLLGDGDAQLVIEALYRLRAAKTEAWRTVRGSGGADGTVDPHVPDGSSALGHHFTPRDFGIPQIDHLLARLDAGPVGQDAPDEPEH